MILGFYVFKMGSTDVVFVGLRPLEQTGEVGELRITRHPLPAAAPIYVHVDNVSRRLLHCPHWSDSALEVLLPMYVAI